LGPNVSEDTAKKIAMSLETGTQEERINGVHKLNNLITSFKQVSESEAKQLLPGNDENTETLKSISAACNAIATVLKT